VEKDKARSADCRARSIKETRPSVSLVVFLVLLLAFVFSMFLLLHLVQPKFDFSRTVKCCSCIFFPYGFKSSSNCNYTFSNHDLTGKLKTRTDIFQFYFRCNELYEFGFQFTKRLFARTAPVNNTLFAELSWKVRLTPLKCLLVLAGHAVGAGILSGVLACRTIERKKFSLQLANNSIL